MISFLNWLFESPHTPAYNYWRAGPPGDLVQQAEIQKQTTLTPECSRYRVSVWLKVHKFGMYREDLCMFDGRRLLEMSAAEELLWRNQLQGNHVNRLFRMIESCRENCGVKRKEYFAPPGATTFTLDEISDFKTPVELYIKPKNMSDTASTDKLFPSHRKTGATQQSDGRAGREDVATQTEAPQAEDDEWRHWVLVGGFRYTEDLKWRLCKELGHCDDVTTVVRASARWLCVRFLHRVSPTTAAHLRERLGSSLCKEVTLTLLFLNADEGTRLGLSLEANYTMAAEGLKVGWLITEL